MLRPTLPLREEVDEGPAGPVTVLLSVTGWEPVTATKARQRPLPETLPGFGRGPQRSPRSLAIYPPIWYS